MTQDSDERGVPLAPMLLLPFLAAVALHAKYVV